MHRLILLQHVSAVVGVQPGSAAKADPDNKLLWRYQPPPLEARSDPRFDAVRQRQAESADGRPGVFPPVPQGVSGTVGDRRGRRLAD